VATEKRKARLFVVRDQTLEERRRGARLAEKVGEDVPAATGDRGDDAGLARARLPAAREVERAEDILDRRERRVAAVVERRREGRGGGGGEAAGAEAAGEEACGRHWHVEIFLQLVEGSSLAGATPYEGVVLY
jgi:hypothetical protein